MRLIFILLLALLSFSTNLFSNDNSSHKFGLYFGGNYNLHSADFYKLRDIPNCCPKFESGTGFGFNIGALYEKKLFSSFWGSIRLGVISYDGELKKDEITTIILNDGPVNGVFQHRMTGEFLNLGFEPGILYSPFDNFFIRLGGRLSNNLSYTYEQIEEIVDPANSGTFADENGEDTHMRTRNESSGSIPGATNFQISVLGGLSYELPLNKSRTLLLSPEISYYLPITEFVEDTEWKVSSISASIAIKYSPMKYTPKLETSREEIRFDTLEIQSDIIAEDSYKPGREEIVQEKLETETEIINLTTRIRVDTFYVKKKYDINADLMAYGVDIDGNEINNPKFVIEEYVSNRLDPLLNYIFFDKNSSELATRYKTLNKNNKISFEIENLFTETTLEVYSNILNIIGKRLLENSNAEITIIGCNAGKSENNDKQLSKDRAIAIKNYLVNIWEIPETRIKVKSRNLPEKASTPIDDPDKIQENQRVELYSTNSEILAPIFIEKIDRKANPPVVRFKAKVNCEAGVDSWNLTALQQTMPGNEFSDTGKEENIQVDWDLAENQKITPQNEEAILYSLEVTDKKKNSKEIINKTLPIDIITIQHKRSERMGDYEIERYSLILFDFNSSKIEGANKEIIDFIKSRVKPESKIEIIGYTDRTGDEDYNKKLSENRAKATMKLLNRQDASVKGLGEEKLLYDNTLPEARFYCRTVQITVKTKIK